MKPIRLLVISIVLACAGTVSLTGLTGCKTAPTERVTQVRTLLAVGESASTTMQVAAKLRVQGKISERQWQDLAAFHDNRYLPAYKLAVAAVSADLSTIASPDIINLVSQLAGMLAEMEKKNQ